MRCQTRVRVPSLPPTASDRTALASEWLPVEALVQHIFAALEYDVGGAQDVHEVIEWAEREAGPDDCYTLFVRFDSPYGRGMVHIAGLDPSVRPEHMTFRRRHPVRRSSELSPDSHE
jgi:hypothetical protein